MILTGVVALWQLAIIIAAPGSLTWITDAGMLVIVPIVFFVGWVALRGSDQSSAAAHSSYFRPPP